MATATPQQPPYPPVDGMAPVELDVEAAQPAAAAPAAFSSRKRLRRISVGGLFAQQDWGSTLATLLLSAALGIVWVSRHAAVAGCDCGPPPARRLAPPASPARRPPLTIHPSTPPQLCTSDTARPFSAADATLAYPIASYGDTWPISWVLAILGCASLATIGAVELWVARHTHADATARCAAFLYFLLDALMALVRLGGLAPRPAAAPGRCCLQPHVRHPASGARRKEACCAEPAAKCLAVPPHSCHAADEHHGD